MKRFTSILFVIFFFASPARADSPLTSTPIHEAYTDVDMVVKAKKKGNINAEIAEFLSSKANSIDEKAAVINALGWDFDGKINANLYAKFIYDKSLEDLKLSEIKGDDLFCIGYMQALDDYFNPSKALPYLEKAFKKNDESFTVAIILALVKAQEMMDSGNWCKMWEITHDVFNNKHLVGDLRDGAKKTIRDYMILYKC